MGVEIGGAFDMWSEETRRCAVEGQRVLEDGVGMASAVGGEEVQIL